MSVSERKRNSQFLPLAIRPRAISDEPNSFPSGKYRLRSICEGATSPKSKMWEISPILLIHEDQYFVVFYQQNCTFEYFPRTIQKIKYTPSKVRGMARVYVKVV
jgi:hypothetical protein